LREFSESPRLLSHADALQAGLTDMLIRFFRQLHGLLGRGSGLRRQGLQPAIELQDRADPKSALCRATFQYAMELPNHVGSIVPNALDPHRDWSSLL
jgi:hypothetical protein